MYRLFSFIFLNGGDENPRPGSTTGAARWTEWPQAMTPAGRAKRVNPPLTTLCDIRLKNKARFSRALSAKIANLTVRIQRSLAERRANAIIFIEANNPYHFIFFKAGQRVTEP